MYCKWPQKEEKLHEYCKNPWPLIPDLLFYTDPSIPAPSLRTKPWRSSFIQPLYHQRCCVISFNNRTAYQRPAFETNHLLWWICTPSLDFVAGVTPYSLLRNAVTSTGGLLWLIFESRKHIKSWFISHTNAASYTVSWLNNLQLISQFMIIYHQRTPAES